MQTENGKVLLRVRPRGFCAGVVRAVDIVELALEAYGAPVYVHHEIVHNTYVVEQLRRRGAIFVESIEDVPHGGVLVFSAHGVPPTVRQEAKDRSLKVIDATCPLVTKVHLEALKFAREKRTIILIGHRDHQEIIGTSGEAPDRTIVVDSVAAVDALEVDDPEKLAFLTQTTLSLYDTQEIVARLRQKFPSIKGPASDDICYATQNRQEAAEQVAKDVDLILVVGSPNSSNSNRLVEVAQRSGVRAQLIDSAQDIDVNRRSIGPGSAGRTGQRTIGAIWLYRPAGFGFDPRRRALYFAAGAGDHRGRAAPLKLSQVRQGRVGRKQQNAAQRGRGNSYKECNLGGQNRPSAEEDCPDWRAFQRCGVFSGDREGSSGAGAQLDANCCWAERSESALRNCGKERRSGFGAGRRMCAGHRVARRGTPLLQAH